jgi:pantoate--beta-alanine ligase
MTPHLVTDRDGLKLARDRAKGPVAVVMTMGALHAGHAALLRQARLRAETVIATIFVNPLQFAPHEDFGTYPRTLDGDLAICADEQVDVVFAPTEDVVYPHGQPGIRVAPGPLGEVLEGASRPGFFGGVLTVVLKLLHLTRPDVAFFGEKDYQQLALISRMVRDTDLDVDVIGIPTVREKDGLALSSRNRYLSAAERQQALELSRALRAGAEAAHDGPEAALKAAEAEILTVGLDYLTATDPLLGPAPASGDGRLLIAAKAGTTRLIDNAAVRFGQE